jgi:eukaryotic-like serine/threonine-protein kinase
VYILNKFSGNEEWSYSPGYYLFNAPFTSSPAVYGDDIYIGSGDGHMYALDDAKKAGPTSPYLYYIVAIIAIIIVALIALRVVRGRRKKKEE